MRPITMTTLKKLFTRIIALCIVAMTTIPFIVQETPPVTALVIYTLFVIGYFVISKKERVRPRLSIVILTILLILTGLLMWNIATTLPQVVFVFFIAFLVSLLLALFFIAVLPRSSSL